MLQNQFSAKLLECFGLPTNIPIVFTEVSNHFSLFDHISIDKVNVQPCALIVRDSNHTNSIFTIGCNQNHLNFVKKYIDCAELYVDSFEAPQKNWQMKISLLINQRNFYVEIFFNVNLQKKSIEINPSKSDIDEITLLQLAFIISSL